MADQLADISRTPITLVMITLDYCGLTFGTSPCLATGTPCYNTFPTCKYKTAYLKQSKDYRFTSADTPLPFQEGERPYLKDIIYLPTEIKDNFTISSRVKATFYDELDSDIGIDPYYAQRSSIQGTFWKKLIARGPNYKGRYVKIYEGFLGQSESEFQQRYIGVIDNIKLNKGETEVEIKDLLKALADIEIPPKLDIKLIADIDASVTHMTLTTVAGLDAPGYIRISDEIIYYTTKNATTNVISVCTRGFFNTVNVVHKVKDKIQKVRYFAPGNPFDHLKTILLTDAGIDSAYVDLVAFDYWRDWPGGELDFSGIFSEPTKGDTLFFELVDLIDCKAWVAENLKITLKRNIPNEPGRVYTYLTDEASIIHDSADVDLNEASRITRFNLNWDKTTLGKVDDSTSYKRIDIAVDLDAEGPNENNGVIEKKVFCRWLRSGYLQEELLAQFVKNFTMRQVRRLRDAQPIITLDVELKDSGIKTGDHVRLTTDEILLPDGNPINNIPFQVIKRDLKGNKITLKLLQAAKRRILIIGPAGLPDYTAASDAQKEYGYIGGADGLMSNGDPAYYIW